jgi:Protein of unknown function (DUF3307)
MNEFLFTTQQGSLIIKLLISHFIADFILQSAAMVRNKKWISTHMFFHIAVVFLCTFMLSRLIYVSITISFFHWFIDGMKMEVKSKYKIKESTLFITDQLLHILTIIVVWFFYFSMSDKIVQAIYFPIEDYKISLMLLAYIWVIYPVGYLIKYAVKNIIQSSVDLKNGTETNIEHGGRLIGIFERIIILTFVLLNQYEAIGFLITGKSIIRFVDNNSNLKSEYVLVGTMMSYGIAIVTGVLVNYLLSNA